MLKAEKVRIEQDYFLNPDQWNGTQVFENTFVTKTICNNIFSSWDFA